MRQGFLVLCWLLLTTTSLAQDNGPLPLGTQAPDFVLQDIQGKPRQLQDFRGKVTVLNFWAFWCDTLKAELPHLKELATRQEEVGFHLVALSVDGTRLPEFLRLTKGQLPFPVLLDAGGKVSQEYHIRHVPTVIVLDANGRIRYVKSGYPGNHRVLAEIRKAATEDRRKATRE